MRRGQMSTPRATGRADTMRRHDDLNGIDLGSETASTRPFGRGNGATKGDRHDRTRVAAARGPGAPRRTPAAPVRRADARPGPDRAGGRHDADAGGRRVPPDGPALQTDPARR